MLLLTSTSDIIRVNTDASGDVRVHTSWVDNVSGTITPGRTNTASITGTGNTTVVAAPGSGQRNVKHISIFNNHASVAQTLIVEHYDGTTAEQLVKVVLAAGESLVMSAVGVWMHYDANKAPYVGLGPMATQTEMEAASSTTVIVTPGRQHFHPSHPKCWGEFQANSTTMLASYNITSVANTAAGAMTVTIANDFSSVNWACLVTRSEDDLTLVYSSTYDAKTAGTVILRSAVEAGSGSHPTSASGNASWSFEGQGDL